VTVPPFLRPSDILRLSDVDHLVKQNDNSKIGMVLQVRIYPKIVTAGLAVVTIYLIAVNETTLDGSRAGSVEEALID
jgi:hypothetical protein